MEFEQPADVVMIIWGRYNLEIALILKRNIGKH